VNRTAHPVRAHHYGMFEFNTVAPEIIDARADAEERDGFTLWRARTGCAVRFTLGNA
jgi:hypothetical protein